MAIVLNTVRVARAFQPEFPGLFFEVLGNGKTWIIALIGPLLALIPDLVYAGIMHFVYPTPAQKIIDYLKENRNSKKETENEKEKESENENEKDSACPLEPSIVKGLND